MQQGVLAFDQTPWNEKPEPPEPNSTDFGSELRSMIAEICAIIAAGLGAVGVLTSSSSAFALMIVFTIAAGLFKFN